MNLTTNHNDNKFEIVEDLPEVGFYLYVYDRQNNCIADFSQNTKEMTKQFALEEFGVPLQSWKEQS